MIFADLFSGPMAILLGMAMLAIAFVMRRSGRKRGKASEKRDVVAEVRREAALNESSAHSRLEQLEVRLYEYGREIDGLAETRIATLRHLIDEADEKIAELQALLNWRDRDDPDRPSSAAA